MIASIAVVVLVVIVAVIFYAYGYGQGKQAAAKEIFKALRVPEGYTIAGVSYKKIE